MPVMMPGSAMGRMTSSEMVSRPKNRVLEIAAQSVPRISAMTVEIADLHRERQRPPDVGGSTSPRTSAA